MNAPAEVSRVPTPWVASEWSGGENHRAGWYVSRMRPDWNANSREWMKDSKGRIAWFPTESAALARIQGGAK